MNETVISCTRCLYLLCLCSGIIVLNIPTVQVVIGTPSCIYSPAVCPFSSKACSDTTSLVRASLVFRSLLTRVIGILESEKSRRTFELLGCSEADNWENS